MLKRAILFLRSKQPVELQRFYQTFGFKFSPITVGAQHSSFFRSNELWISISKTEGDADTRFYIDSGVESVAVIGSAGDISDVKKEEIPPLVQRLLDLKSEIVTNNTQIPITTVARVENIESAKNNLDRFVGWVKEKHGNGPVHYCLSKDQITIELYKKRKVPLSSNHLEFVFEPGEFAIDTAGLDIIREGETNITVKSPDDHIVTCLKPKLLENRLVRA